MSTKIKDALSSCAFGIFLTYSTVKVVTVRNTYVALLNRILQIAVVAYIALYIVWYKKGYQTFVAPNGISVIKVKGLAQIRVNNGSAISDQFSKVWDTAEYEVPPLEHNAFFIATRQIVTSDQHEGICPSALRSKAFCRTDTDCPKGHESPSKFGYYTGNCVPSLEAPSNKTCEIEGWCPEEYSASSEYQIDKSALNNFTVYIKSIATFLKLSLTLGNVRPETNFSCLFDSSTNPKCPIFEIGYILNYISKKVGEDVEPALLKDGGLIEIEQKWSCNFDFDAKRCFPTYDFRLLQSGNDVLSPGINYRYVHKYRSNLTDYRTLIKVYGLRFIVTTTGQGGRFNIVNLFVAIGSGIGFMIIASIICDFIFLHFHQARKHYRDTKFSVCETEKTDGDKTVLIP